VRVLTAHASALGQNTLTTYLSILERCLNIGNSLFLPKNLIESFARDAIRLTSIDMRQYYRLMALRCTSVSPTCKISAIS